MSAWAAGHGAEQGCRWQGWLLPRSDREQMGQAAPGFPQLWGSLHPPAGTGLGREGPMHPGGAHRSLLGTRFAPLRTWRWMQEDLAAAELHTWEAQDVREGEMRLSRGFL